MFELMNGIRSILEVFNAVRPGEHVLIVTDDDGRSVWIGQLFMSAAGSMGAEAVLTVMTPRQFTAKEPPASLATAMKSANAIFYISDSVTLAHSSARKEAIAAGARFYLIFQIPVEDLKRGVKASDLKLIKEQTEKVARFLTRASAARVTTPLGTDITMSLAGRDGAALHCLRESGGSLPYYAEAAICPVEGSAEGIMVIDQEIVGWGYLFREPVRLTVKAGKVIDIAGSTQDADRLREIAATDENATNIAELGIGTSHIIPWPMHGTRRDAGRIGTAHIGIGRNDDIGGNIWSNIHADGLMSKATIELDNQFVLKEGELLI